MAKRAPILLAAVRASQEAAQAAQAACDAQETARARQAAREAAAKRVRRSLPVRVVRELVWFGLSIAATLIAIVVLNLLLNPGSDFSSRVLALWGGLVSR